MELPSRFTGSERDQEAATQASHLRMSPKPTDGLLACLAAVRAANLDLGIIKRGLGDGASLSDKHYGQLGPRVARIAATPKRRERGVRL